MKIKTCLVGLGYWSKHYLRLLSENPDVDLVAVCDKDKEALKRTQEAYPNIVTSDTIEGSIKHHHFDAAIVCTPLTTHFDIVKKLLVANKHVLCEKAFTTNSDEAQALIGIAEGMGCTLEIGQTFLYNSLVQRIKKYIDDGALGKIRYIYAQRTGKSPVRQDCSSLWDLSSHDISMILYWLNWEMPTECSVFGQSYLQDKIQDVTFCNLRFSNDVIVNLHASWMDHVKQRKVTIIGTENMLVFDDIAQTITIYHSGGIEIPNVPYTEPLKAQVDDFIQSIQQNRKPKVTGEDGRNVVKVLEMCNQSMAKNK
jgi:predicted dehydrogenase